MLGKRQQGILRRLALQTTPTYRFEAAIGYYVASRETGYGYQILARLIVREDNTVDLQHWIGLSSTTAAARDKCREVEEMYQEYVCGLGEP